MFFNMWYNVMRMEEYAMSKVTILGTGAWGIALGMLIEHNGHELTMWSKFSDEIDELKNSRESKKYLPGVKIPESIYFTDNLDCVKDAEVVLLAVPSFAIADVCREIKTLINPDALILNAGKGLEPNSGVRFSQIISDILERENSVVALSGPTHAEEVAIGIPSSVVVACQDIKKAEAAQDLLMSEYMRAYVNSDIVGVELGGALKNIIALCAGICDGLDMGDNTKAALITRGLAEITRLGMAMGGKPETFLGLAGMGDLCVTCYSKHSRNNRAGRLIGEGIEPKKAIEQIGTVEGFYALETVYKLSKDMNVEMPIISECYNIFNNGLSPIEAISHLMLRPKKSEKIEL